MECINDIIHHIIRMHYDAHHEIIQVIVNVNLSSIQFTTKCVTYEV